MLKKIYMDELKILNAELTKRIDLLQNQLIQTRLDIAHLRGEMKTLMYLFNLAANNKL